MFTLGIDIGSASSKVIILDTGKDIVAKSVIPGGTGTDGPYRALDKAYKQSGLKPAEIKRIIATGYGRLNFRAADNQISEITCHAKGVYQLLPTARTIIDIGGQDVKVIRLGANGLVNNFVMNDKCAAGTGRFLEVMARVLGIDISEMATMAEHCANTVSISSICTVFAESEVISHLSAGASPADVIAGIHQSVAKRVAGLVFRVGLIPDVVITGGVAKNQSVVTALADEIKTPIQTAPYAQLTGALGAAILAWEDYQKTKN